jgi:hypothetical protein
MLTRILSKRELGKITKWLMALAKFRQKLIRKLREV